VTAPLRNWLWPPPAPVVEDPEDPETPAINDRKPPATGPKEMAWIPGGWFWVLARLRPGKLS
jgi:hypothetical protein